MKTSKEYQHLIRFNQDCFDPYMIGDHEYGSIDLYYAIEDTTLFIKALDHQTNRLKEFEIAITNKETRTENILENYLIELISNEGNFYGKPFYESSEVFSQEQFQSIYNKGIALRKEKIEIAKALNENNELLAYFKFLGLNPRPSNGSIEHWEARCLCGGNHTLMITTTTNEWGCGYCKKKGDINDLKLWNDSRNKAKMNR